MKLSMRLLICTDLRAYARTVALGLTDAVSKAAFCLLLTALISERMSFGQERVMTYAQLPTDAAPTTIQISGQTHVVTTGYLDGSAWAYSLAENKRHLIHKHDSPVALFVRNSDQNGEVVASVSRGGDVFYFTDELRRSYSWLMENRQVVQSLQGKALSLVKGTNLSCRTGPGFTSVAQSLLDNDEKVIAVAESGANALTRLRGSLYWLDIKKKNRTLMIQDAFSEAVDDENVTAALILSEEKKTAIIVLNNPEGIGANIMCLGRDNNESTNIAAPIGADACVALCKSGDMLAVGAEHLELWSTKSLTVLERSPPLDSAAMAISVSEDGNIVVAALRHGKVVIWNVQK